MTEAAARHTIQPNVPHQFPWYVPLQSDLKRGNESFAGQGFDAVLVYTSQIGEGFPHYDLHYRSKEIKQFY